MVKLRKILINFIGVFKYLLAYIIFKARKSNKKYFLIAEKENEARDNGYHFFKYMCNIKSDYIPVYVIRKKSADLKKVANLGKVIKYNSFYHYYIYISAYACIGSQTIPYPGSKKLCMTFFKLKREKQIFVWLQHGITKDNLPYKNMSKENTKYDLVTCSSKREQELFINNYGYSNNEAMILGLCRFDNLPLQQKEPSKIILIMPTFRSWLSPKDVLKGATYKENNKFLESDFFLTFSSLFKNIKFLDILKKYNYKVVFYLHYALQSYTKNFEYLFNNKIIIADKEHYDVQKLLIDSDILITDFSSVFFDFAFMKKPLIYFQFDQEKYREYHYKDGYFSYQNDGFGKVVRSIDDLVNEVSNLIECGLDSKYLNRIYSFFEYLDHNNCQRTYNSILEKMRVPEKLCK